MNILEVPASSICITEDFTKMHGVTSQKTVTLMLYSMSISDLLSFCFFLALCCVCETCVCNKALLCCVGCIVASVGFQGIWTVCNWCHITFMAVGGMKRIQCPRNSRNCDVCWPFAFVPLTLELSRRFLKAFDSLFKIHIKTYSEMHFHPVKIATHICLCLHI